MASKKKTKKHNKVMQISKLLNVVKRFRLDRREWQHFSSEVLRNPEDKTARELENYFLGRVCGTRDLLEVVFGRTAKAY